MERRGQMRAIAATLHEIARPALGKRGSGFAHLLTHWREVVGPELADETSPEKLSFPRGERIEGTLRLRATPASALALQHRVPLVIERINGFFGYRAVARIVIVQGKRAPSRPPTPEAPRLSAEDEKALDARLAGVADPTLRAALRGLGAQLPPGRKPR